ncbi:hypothetical protein B0H16DRAFT_1560366 [Mycena metata]|uniref:BTB domain-containing protein n=1 Tax=Mycena metata TaxID=1033252 RepID=A0AAD7N4L6_9AGAR|nr:hypothetical protein B0H16DRAFT_1560366 [Mycena metata]
MEKRGEHWGPAGVASTFEIVLPEGDALNIIYAGATLHTDVCGFGWRFASVIDIQRAPRPVLLGEDGNHIPSWTISLFFDPYFMRGAEFGIISIGTKVEHLIPDKANAVIPARYHLPNAGHNLHALGVFVHPSSASTPNITFTVAFSPSLGLALPRSLARESQLKSVLKESLTGKDLLDMKFYAFSRFGSGVATHPLPLFAKVSLLTGFPEDLDNLLDGGGFSESSIVNLDIHTPEDSQFDGYGYDSDSDFESDEEQEPEALSSGGVSSDGEHKNSRAKSPPNNSIGVEKYLRRGRIVVLKDTAYRTWKALLYYLYTRQINFAPLRSENCLGLETEDPQCLAKSMYRLADKLGLEELKSSALQYIRSRLSEDNILQEVFSSFTSMYPTLQTLEIKFLTSNFTPKVTENLKQMTKEIC